MGIELVACLAEIFYADGLVLVSGKTLRQHRLPLVGHGRSRNRNGWGCGHGLVGVLQVR